MDILIHTTALLCVHRVQPWLNTPQAGATPPVQLSTAETA